MAYRGGRPYHWGFEARDLSIDQLSSHQQVVSGLTPKHTRSETSNTVEIHNLFKVWLADGDLARLGEEYTQYFLKQLRIFVEEYLSQRNLEVRSGGAKYLFSFPTTWDERIIGRFHSLIEGAGYKLTTGQKSFLSLDEANAAMAFFHHDDKRKPNDGDLVLVADIGGATSDVCVGQINHNAGKALGNITIKSPGYGYHTGSTYIDDSFKMNLADYLRQQCRKLWPNVNPNVVDQAIAAALNHFELGDKYKSFKHGFNESKGQTLLAKKATNLTIDLSVTDPATGRTYSHRAIVPRYELFKEAFQEQYNKIIDQLIHELDDEEKKKGLKHVVLAGGLGSSLYIVSHLRDDFRRFSPYNEPTIEALNDADLAVSSGLVHHEIATLKSKGDWYCQAENFFGIQQGDAKEDEVFAIFKPEDSIKVGDIRRVKLKVDFDQSDKLLSSLRLVSHIEKPPKQKLLRKGDPYKKWCKSLNILKELTPSVNVS